MQVLKKGVQFPALSICGSGNLDHTLTIPSVSGGTKTGTTLGSSCFQIAVYLGMSIAMGAM